MIASASLLCLSALVTSPHAPSSSALETRRARAPVPHLVEAVTTWTDLTTDSQRLTDASIARTVATIAEEGVLCTALAGQDIMFTTPAPFVVDKSGSVAFPIDSAEAASNLAENTRATFYAKAPKGGAASGSVLSLVGHAEPFTIDEVSDADLNELSASCGVPTEALAAKAWARIAPERVHIFDAVRSAEAWVAPTDYAEAEPNLLAQTAPTLIAKLNTQHAAALRRFAGLFTGVPTDELTAEVVSIDQMGFDMRLQLGPIAPPSFVRAGFKYPPANAEEGTSVFMKLFQEAYERENGFLV